MGIKERQMLCSFRSLKAICSSANSSVFTYYIFTLDLVLPRCFVSLWSFAVTVLLLRKLSAFTKKFFACPVVFWQYHIASALHRGYYCFNLPGNIMSHFNGFLLLNDSDSMNAHTHVYTFRAKPSL